MLNSMIGDVQRKEFMNEAYDCILITTGAVGVSMLSRRALGEPAGSPESLEEIVILAAS